MRVDLVKIRYLRLAHRLSTEHMANLLGYKHASSYYRAERGDRQFRPHQIAILASQFNVPMESLFLSDEVTKVAIK